MIKAIWSIFSHTPTKPIYGEWSIRECTDMLDVANDQSSLDRAIGRFWEGIAEFDKQTYNLYAVVFNCLPEMLYVQLRTDSQDLTFYDKLKDAESTIPDEHIRLLTSQLMTLSDYFSIQAASSSIESRKRDIAILVKGVLSSIQSGRLTQISHPLAKSIDESSPIAYFLIKLVCKAYALNITTLPLAPNTSSPET